MATTESESSLVHFDMALTSYSTDSVPLDYIDPEQLFGKPGFYPGDAAACFGNPFELEDYSCLYDDNGGGAAEPLPCYDPSSQLNYVYATDGLECLYPKRQRTEGSFQFPEFPPKMAEAPELFNFPSECCCYDAGCDGESGSGRKRKSGGRPSPSAQSMAARERRRRITEKTAELGRLVPGGGKMTTAEMLQAAHKYIRFLQAQVGLLQLIQPEFDELMQVKEEVPQRKSVGHIGALLGSWKIQEKLYTEEKCLATEELVDEIRSSQGMLGELEVVVNGY